MNTDKMSCIKKTLQCSAALFIGLGCIAAGVWLVMHGVSVNRAHEAAYSEEVSGTIVSMHAAGTQDGHSMCLVNYRYYVGADRYPGVWYVTCALGIVSWATTDAIVTVHVLPDHPDCSILPGRGGDPYDQVTSCTSFFSASRLWVGFVVGGVIIALIALVVTPTVMHYYVTRPAAKPVVPVYEGV